MLKLLFTFLARGVSAAAAFLFSILIARLLPQESAGEYFTGLTIMTGASVIIRFGFDNYIIKKNVMDEGRATANLISFALYSVVIFTTLIALVCLAISVLSDFKTFATQYEVFLYFLAASLFFALLWLASGFLKAQRKAPLANFLEAGLVPVALIFTYGLFYQSVTLLQAAQIYLAILVSLVAVIYAWILIKFGAKLNLTTLSMKELQESSGIMASNLMDFLVLWFSALILTKFAHMSDVADFQIAQRLSVLISFILIVINSISAPVYAQLFRDNQIDKVGQILRLTTSLMTLIALFPLVLFWFFPEFLLSFFGNAYKDASTSLLILSFGQLVNVMSGSVGYVLMMSGHSHVYKMNTLYSAVASIILSIVLIPEYGAIGAAIASSTGLAAKNLLGVYSIYKLFGLLALPTFKQIAKIFTLRERYEILTHRH